MLVVASALATVTHRVELGSLVSCTAFRGPALLAKMADTIDEISSSDQRRTSRFIVMYRGPGEISSR